MILDIITTLRATSSTNMKESILALYTNDDEWKNYLISVYNPYIKYNKTGDKNGLRDDVDNLKLCRSIDAGISAKTINKVYGDIIPSWGVQKALDFKNFKATKKRTDTINFPCVAQYKYDGFSFTCIVGGAKPQFYTSGGHLFEIEESIFDNAEEGVYLGEMMGVGVTGKFGDRTKCGIQTTFRTNTAKGVKNYGFPNFKIFEYLTLTEFYDGKARLKYEDRWIIMFNANLEIEGLDIGKATVEGKYCADQNELNEFYYNALDAGWEGIIIRQPDHLWHNDGKRTDGLVKRKDRQPVDLLCFDWKEGNGKNQGKIGSLGLRDKRGREVWVAPRTDADKERDPQYYIGEIIEVVYEQLLKDGTYVQPVFNAVRFDKAEGDYQ